MINENRKNLQIVISKEVLKDIPEESISVRKAAELFEEIVHPNELKEYTFSAAKTYFLPLILTTMMEEDITFQYAVHQSRERFSEMYDQLEKIAKDPISKNMAITIIQDLFSELKDVDMKNPEVEEDLMTVALQDITPKMKATLEKTYVLDAVKKIAEDSIIRSTIKRCKVEPLQQEIEKALHAFCKKAEIDMGELDDLLKMFTQELDQEYVLTTLSVIVSEIIRKAIEKDIKFSEAVMCINSANIYNKIIKDVENVEAINKRMAVYEKVLKVVFDAIYTALE